MSTSRRAQVDVASIPADVCSRRVIQRLEYRKGGQSRLTQLDGVGLGSFASYFHRSPA